MTAVVRLAREALRGWVGDDADLYAAEQALGVWRGRQMLSADEQAAVLYWWHAETEPVPGKDFLPQDQIQHEQSMVAATVSKAVLR